MHHELGVAVVFLTLDSTVVAEHTTCVAAVLISFLRLPSVVFL